MLVHLTKAKGCKGSKHPLNSLSEINTTDIGQGFQRQQALAAKKDVSFQCL